VVSASEPFQRVCLWRRAIGVWSWIVGFVKHLGYPSRWSFCSTSWIRLYVLVGPQNGQFWWAIQWTAHPNSRRPYPLLTC
jgi:hypothetical protein